MTTVATMRGMTNFLIGSVPSARIASICSVTTIDPSSEAMPEALRPETIKPVSTGPSSLIMEKETSCPVMALAPNCASEVDVWRASTPPVKNPVSRTIGIEPTPMESACVKMSEK